MTRTAGASTAALGSVGQPAPNSLSTAAHFLCLSGHDRLLCRSQDRGPRHYQSVTKRRKRETSETPVPPRRRRRANTHPPGFSPRQKNKPLFVKGLARLAPCPSQGTLRNTLSAMCKEHVGSDQDGEKPLGGGNGQLGTGTVERRRADKQMRLFNLQ